LALIFLKVNWFFSIRFKIKVKSKEGIGIVLTSGAVSVSNICCLVVLTGNDWIVAATDVLLGCKEVKELM
jgi:hypothetical protein